MLRSRCERRMEHPPALLQGAALFYRSQIPGFLDFSTCCERARRGQTLWQKRRRAGLVIQQVERHAAAPELLQEGGNFGVLPCPVALQRDDAALGKGAAHRLAVEGCVLVDQTGD